MPSLGATAAGKEAQLLVDQLLLSAAPLLPALQEGVTASAVIGTTTKVVCGPRSSLFYCLRA